MKLLENPDDSSRLEELLQTLQRMACGDIRAQIPHSGRKDALDAIALGINALAGELLFTTVSRDELDAVIDTMPDLLLVLTRQGVIRRANRSACAVLEREPEDVEGRTLAELLDGGPDAFADVADELARADGHRTREWVFRSSTCEPIPMSVTVAALSPPPACERGFVIVGRDLRETFRLMKEAAGRDQAIQASEAKTVFLANISHEIRTPVTAILGYLQMLLNFELPEERRRSFLTRAEESCRSLTQLLSDLLDLSRIEAGKVNVDLKECRLDTLLDDLREKMTARAQAKGVGFRITQAGSLPETLVTDPLRLGQILTNLLSNAIKFTEAGEVGLDLSSGHGLAGGPVLFFDISDTAMGISPAEQARLFQPFSQANAGIAGSFGGTGLGLALARGLARELGGEVSLHRSEIDKGSTFRLALPARRGESSGPGDSQAAPGAVALEGLRVLLADDNADNREIFSAFLRRARAEVHVVSDGQEAVEASLRPGPPFDLILMDIRMPRMDGLEAVRHLRESGVAVPIVALSAYAMLNQQAEAIASGFSAFLSKPTSESTFLQTLASVLGRRS